MKLPVQVQAVSRDLLGTTYLGFKAGINPSYFCKRGTGTTAENNIGNLTPTQCCAYAMTGGVANRWVSDNNHTLAACQITNNCGDCLNQPGGSLRVCRNTGAC